MKKMNSNEHLLWNKVWIDQEYLRPVVVRRYRNTSMTIGI